MPPKIANSKVHQPGMNNVISSSDMKMSGVGGFVTIIKNEILTFNILSYTNLVVGFFIISQIVTGKTLIMPRPRKLEENSKSSKKRIHLYKSTKRNLPKDFVVSGSVNLVS